MKRLSGPVPSSDRDEYRKYCQTWYVCRRTVCTNGLILSFINWSFIEVEIISSRLTGQCVFVYELNPFSSLYASTKIEWTFSFMDGFTGKNEVIRVGFKVHTSSVFKGSGILITQVLITCSNLFYFTV